MDTFIESLIKNLYDKVNNIINIKKNQISIPEELKEEFFSLVDKVNLSLMEDKDNFYGYFLFQMSREIRFDISSPTSVNFKGAKYVIYFNPLIFLNLNIKQMESTIKHEILHILSLHLIRGKEYKGKFGTLAVNMAMDIVVNTYLDNLPPYAITLEWVNLNYFLKLLPFESFEYYAENIQTAVDLKEEDKEGEEDDSNKAKEVETDFDPEKTHDIWEDSSYEDEKTVKEFTEKFIDNSQKGYISDHLENMISLLKKEKGELPWNLYLKRLMGSVERDKKKTVTRRNRRQPERLDLRGQLRNHKAKILVALDISGSISDEEFNQAIKEVLHIVKNNNNEISIIECDSEIRCVYEVKSEKDIKDRINTRGGTKFTPVFEYANKNNANLLVYFTDGLGEDKLNLIPKGYKTLWVISGRGDKLSLKEPYGVVKKLKSIKIKDNSLDINDVVNDGYSMNNQERIY